MKKLVEADLVERTVDQIRADKQAWLDRKERNRVKHDAAYKAYRDAENKLLIPIEQALKEKLSPFNLLEFQIDADFYWGDSVRVSIKCDQNKLHDDSSSLSWNYEVTLNSDGELKKESGSWSGLRACTREQLDTLKQTVAALEVLNDVDWPALLAIKQPEYDDYYNYEKEDETPEYDYDVELNMEQIRELINSGKAIRIRNFKDDSRWASDLFFVPVKETPKKIEGTIFSARYIDGGEDPKAIYRNNRWTEPVLKSKIKIVEPVQIIDVE